MSRFAKMVIAVAFGAAALVASALAFADSAHAQGHAGARSSGGFRGGAISRPAFAGNRGMVRAAPRAGYAAPRARYAAPRVYRPGVVQRRVVRPGVYGGYPRYRYRYYVPNPAAWPYYGYGYGYSFGYPVAAPYVCETRRVRVRTKRGWRIVWRRYCY